MKKFLKAIVVLLIVSLSLPVLIGSSGPEISGKKELRGMWVATVLNIDYPSKAVTDPEILKSEAVRVLDSAQSMGLNAVFLQVRPASDALYKSKYFPWSKYLTGKQGQAPAGDFDPLGFWVEEAHKRGLELHAWINPYRVTKKKASEPSYDFASLAATNPAKLHQDWVVKYSDGDLYYNPGLPEVRELIINGVLEIIQNYDVDGIHFDDYFYPGKDFNDKATFAKYGAGYKNIDDWRRANVDTLISDLSKAIKATSKDVSFGISPFGIWANKSSNALGSDTKGMQSYYDHYADTRKWVKDGLLDYIAPQLYWNIGYSLADYSKLAAWWKDTVSGSGVALYIGHAAYKTGDSSPSSPWYGVGEIEKQLKLNAQIPEISGSIFYNYKSLANSPALSAAIKAFYQQKDGSAAAGIPVTVSKPSENIKTSFDKFYLNGASDPGKPLYLNGQPVENRSPQGYFGVLVPLEKGENIFTLSQDGSYVTRVIYRETAVSASKSMSAADIVPESVFPQSQEYRLPGEKITLSCQAPIGSKVTVKINGKSYAMKPAATKASGTGIYSTTFTYTYTIPSFTGTPRNVNLGTPAYTMNYNGKTKTRTAPASIGAIMKNSPYYAEVAKPVIDTYQTTTTSNGAAYELYSGMTDYVTGMTGKFVRLASGLWVYKSDVKLYTSKTQLQTTVKNAAYVVGEKWDSLVLELSSAAAATAAFDGTALKVDIATASSVKIPSLPADSLVASIEAAKGSGKAQYILKLKDNQRIEGYYIEKTSSGIALNIKRPVRTNGGEAPLFGITIMLDAGHGGSSTGAIGPLGVQYAEKTIVLEMALKLQNELEQLGATVLMTRTTDKDVSLEERLAASRNARPDLFISLHANSMEDNVDISKVEGFSVFYREKTAQPIAEAIFNDTIDILKRADKGVHVSNFYVNRGTWTPSILIESGFVPNPTEFEWLTDQNAQTQLVKSISASILRYFAN